jgi:hypothetical protein
MLSYSWGYSFGKIGSALMAYCKKEGLDQRTTYVWICCICINQHRVVEGDQLRASAKGSHSIANIIGFAMTQARHQRT